MDRHELANLILARLDAEAPRIRAEFSSPRGTRTRHAVVDDLLPTEIAHRIHAAFGDGSAFLRRDSFRERKKTLAKLDRLPAIAAEISYAIQDPAVVAKVGKLTGMERLEPDASLYAGGLSMMTKGDFLNPHIDNSHDAARERYRRLNLLYYVTPDWREENGGNLELWDDDVRKPVTLTSKFNRLAIMETNKHSMHSVSPVVADGARTCVSSYYFSEISPDGSEYFHVTSFSARPEQGLLRAVSAVDAAARNVAGRVLGLGRGKDEVNKG
jgi:Rps23 Pro-64 3,4-dihydroxylase Tpa1-like proline 4-hydroxylase